MTWVCPLCGFENLKEPLNSRHKPKCGGCNKDMKLASEVQDEINQQRGDCLEMISLETNRLNRAKEEIEALKSDLSHAQIAFDNSKKIILDCKKELTRLNTIHIYRDIDRETKVNLDVIQKKIIEVN